METHKLYRDNPYQTSCEAEVVAISDKGIQLNQTVFYGEAGGQIGDTGRLNDLIIGDAQHSVGQMLLRADAPMIQVRTKINHMAAGAVPFKIGDAVQVKIDWDRYVDEGKFS